MASWGHRDIRGGGCNIPNWAWERGECDPTLLGGKTYSLSWQIWCSIVMWLSRRLAILPFICWFYHYCKISNFFFFWFFGTCYIRIYNWWNSGFGSLSSLGIPYSLSPHLLYISIYKLHISHFTSLQLNISCVGPTY